MSVTAGAGERWLFLGFACPLPWPVTVHARVAAGQTGGRRRQRLLSDHARERACLPHTGRAGEMFFSSASGEFLPGLAFDLLIMSPCTEVLRLQVPRPHGHPWQAHVSRMWPYPRRYCTGCGECI